MTVLITGADGQLAHALCARMKMTGEGRVVAPVPCPARPDERHCRQ